MSCEHTAGGSGCGLLVAWTAAAAAAAAAEDSRLLGRRAAHGSGSSCRGIAAGDPCCRRARRAAAALVCRHAAAAAARHTPMLCCLWVLEAQREGQRCAAQLRRRHRSCYGGRRRIHTCAPDSCSRRRAAGRSGHVHHRTAQHIVPSWVEGAEKKYPSVNTFQSTPAAGADGDMLPTEATGTD